MRKKLINLIIPVFLLISVVFFVDARVCSAALLDGIACISDGSCQINNALQLVVVVYKEILGLIGSVVLLMFVIGGTMLILSGGSSERVEKGKKIITGSIIGMIIVLTSYLIISFTLQLMGATNKDNWSEPKPIEATLK